MSNQAQFENALKELVELHFDAVEAYETALNKIEDHEYKKKLYDFKNDHLRHINEFSDLLRKHNVEPPTGPSITKQWLAKGKVMLANLINDTTILSAMFSNEEDAHVAYQKLNERTDKWEDAIQLLKKGMEDEGQHKKWFEDKTR